MFVAVTTCLLATLALSCLPEKRVAQSDADILTVFESEARAFRTNHDSDRREEGATLFGQIEMGTTTGDLRKILGDPAPVISTNKRWVYELGGEDTFVFELKNNMLIGSYWLTAPPQTALTEALTTLDPATPETQATATAAGAPTTKPSDFQE